jgi:competence protein ComEA
MPAAAALAGPVNVNSADATTLARELDGIGPAKAQAIVEYRQQNGPFRSADDLLQVDGIGDRVLELNRANIRLNGGAAAPAPKGAQKPGQKPAQKPAQKSSPKPAQQPSGSR